MSTFRCFPAQSLSEPPTASVSITDKFVEIASASSHEAIVLSKIGSVAYGGGVVDTNWGKAMHVSVQTAFSSRVIWVLGEAEAANLAQLIKHRL
jgi:hypothetical protein